MDAIKAAIPSTPKVCYPRRIIGFSFRWDVHQTGDREIEIEIPVGNGPCPINPEFARVHDLSDIEIKQAELSVLRDVAIRQ